MDEERRRLAEVDPELHALLFSAYRSLRRMNMVASDRVLVGVRSGSIPPVVAMMTASCAVENLRRRIDKLGPKGEAAIVDLSAELRGSDRTRCVVMIDDSVGTFSIRDPTMS